MPNKSTMLGQQKTASKIMDIAENSMRDKGYNSFSFREIAKEIGIKSASVHYHFPTKADLATAVVKRYTRTFMEKLGEPDNEQQTASMLLERYVGEFERVLLRDQKMCIGGVLGAEAGALPLSVTQATQQFFEANIQWLSVVLQRKQPDKDPVRVREEAFQLLATLEGGLILARSLEDFQAFRQLVKASLSL